MWVEASLEIRKEHFMDQLTERLVEYALALSYEDLPPEVVERTKRLILDTVGCALGAAPWQAPSVARALAEDVQSRTPATVMAYDMLLGLSESAAHGVSRGWGGASFQVIAAAAASRLFGLTRAQMRQAI